MGTPILLKEFSFDQVKTLADFYKLDWNDFTICRLLNEVGGHPYFVRLAMYQIKVKNIALKHYSNPISVVNSSISVLGLGIRN